MENTDLMKIVEDKAKVHQDRYATFDYDRFVSELWEIEENQPGYIKWAAKQKTARVSKSLRSRRGISRWANRSEAVEKEVNANLAIFGIQQYD